MSFKKLVAAVAAVAATLALGLGSAQAATYSLVGLQSGPLANPGSFVATVNASVADAMATLDFVVQGFRSLDGNNSYRDVLSLSINGGSAITGSFNLGGGGTSDTSFGGATAVTVNQNGVNPGTVIGWQGGTTTITGLRFNLLAGVNTFTFAYSAPGALNYGGQPLSDEGWGIKSAMVTAVPEPETYAMMLAGLGLMGAIARRRKAKQA